MLPKLGILAGGGSLPELIVQYCLSIKREFHVIAFKGQATKNSFKDIPHTWVRLGAAGYTIRTLRNAGVKELVLAGSINRPSLAMLFPDLWTIQFLKNTRAHKLGDDGLLRALIDTVESIEGFTIVGIDELLPNLLAKEGVYGNVHPTLEDENNIIKGIHEAKELGRRDIGQSVITRLGKVILSEDTLGTDAMLKKARTLRLKNSDGVLVKVKKPDQERRADLPTIGLKTIEALAQAGLKGIAIEAKNTLVLDSKTITQAANTHGLFIKGVKAPPIAPLIFLIAGEPSGDILGGRLMKSLKVKTKNNISFAGIGGDTMQKQGLKSLIPMTDLSIMGLFEILPRIPLMTRHIKKTTDQIIHLKPKAVITIDSPGFNFRVAKRLKNKGIKLIHYVAPSVWAWRPKRAAKTAETFDHLLSLLPFEPPLFEAEGLPTTFVGHSVIESNASFGNGEAFRKRHSIPMTDIVIVVLLGSRNGEILRHEKIFGEAIHLLKSEIPNLHIIVPTLPVLADQVRNLSRKWKQSVLIVDNENEKFNAFSAANIALAASGTVALELALSRTPAIIAYKLNPLTWFFARWLVKVRFVHLVNIILNSEEIPEFIQNDCNAVSLAKSMGILLKDRELRNKQIIAYEKALKELRVGEYKSAELAADTIVNIINK